MPDEATTALDPNLSDNAHQRERAGSRSSGARAIISALYANVHWRILHVAGHGALPDEKTGSKGGVVLSNDTFLGPDEVASMRIVPELVFFNCCHLGRGDDRALLNPRYNRAQFASGVAQELIRIGVKVVVAAGVGGGRRCGEARSRADVLWGATERRALHRRRRSRAQRGARRIAAVEHLGRLSVLRLDPDWRFRRNISDPNRGSDAPGEFEGVASELQIDLALRRMTIEIPPPGTRCCLTGAATPHSTGGSVRSQVAGKPGLSTTLGTLADRFVVRPLSKPATSRAASRWYRRGLAADDGGALDSFG